MPAVLCRHIGHLEQTGQHGHAAFSRQWSIAAPYDVFALLTEATNLRAAVHLIPYSDAAPHPTGPLDSIGQGWQLPPVNEQRTHSARLAGGPRGHHNLMHERCPRTLRQRIPGKIRIGVSLLSIAGVLIPRVAAPFSHAHAAAGIWWIGNDRGIIGSVHVA